jgi:hypothetical protein
MTTERAEPVLSVVVVTFNSAAVLPAALEPLKMSESFEIIVVDNASSDETIEFLAREFPSVRVIANASNVGFARAVNIGVSTATAPIVMLLNPDASIGIDAVELLLDRVKKEDAGLVAPWVQHQSQRIVSAGWLPTPWRMLTHYSGLSRIAGNRNWLQGHYLLPGQLSRETPVQWVTGACFVCRRPVWDHLKGLSERWFMYAEDIEFSHRVTAEGLTNLVLREAVAHHVVGGSDSTASLTGRSDWVLNLRDFYATELARSRRSPLMWTAIVVAGLLSRAAVFAAIGLRSRGPRRANQLDNARHFFGYARSLVFVPWKRDA